MSELALSKARLRRAAKRVAQMPLSSREELARVLGGSEVLQLVFADQFTDAQLHDITAEGRDVVRHLSTGMLALEDRVLNWAPTARLADWEPVHLPGVAYRGAGISAVFEEVLSPWPIVRQREERARRRAEPKPDLEDHGEDLFYEADPDQ